MDIQKTHLLILLQLVLSVTRIWASTAPSFAPNSSTLTKEAPAPAPSFQEKAGVVPTDKPAGIDRSSNGHGHGHRNFQKTEWDMKPSNVLFEFSSSLGKFPRDASNNNNNDIRQSGQNSYVSLNPSMQPPPPYLPPPLSQQQQHHQQARRPENNFEQQPTPTTFLRPMQMQMPPLQMYLRPPPQNQAQNPNLAPPFQPGKHPDQFPQAQQQQQQQQPQPQWTGVPKNYFPSTTSSTAPSLLPVSVLVPNPSQSQSQSQSPQMSYHSNQIDTEPSREISFLIHRPGDESLIKNTISEDSQQAGQNVEFIRGQNLKLTQQQRVYLPPKPKTIVYIMMTEPQVETNVQVMGQSADGVDVEGQPEPEVYVVYQKSNQQRKTLHHGQHEEVGHGGGYSGYNGSTGSGSSSDLSGPSEFHIPILPKSEDVYQTSSSNNVVNHHVNIFGQSFKKEYGIGIQNGGVQKLNLVNSVKYNATNNTIPVGHRNNSNRSYNPNPNSVIPTAASAEASTTKRQSELLPMCRTV